MFLTLFVNFNNVCLSVLLINVINNFKINQVYESISNFFTSLADLVHHEHYTNINFVISAESRPSVIIFSYTFKLLISK